MGASGTRTPSRRWPQGTNSALLWGAVLWLSVLALALLGPTRESLTLALVAYSAGFVALTGLWASDTGPLDSPRILLGGALLLRLTIFPALPDLSDDLFRYVWDGWLGVSGMNPYRHVPSAGELEAFRDTPLFGQLNSPGFHSIYLPFSQVVFLAGGGAYQAYGWPAAAYAIKAVFLVLEFSGLAFLLRAVQRTGGRVRGLALYALNPLVLVTLTAGGHSESALVFGFGLLAYGTASGRYAIAWTGLVLATATKGIPILLAPLLLRSQRIRGHEWRAILAGLLPAGFLSAGLTAPYYFPGVIDALGSSADLYVRFFEFNAGPYFLLKEMGLWLIGTDLSKQLGPALRAVSLGGAALVWLRWPMNPSSASVEFFRGSVAILGLYLLAATTLHPWYLVWGLALIPLAPRSCFRYAWVWASWAAFLTYYVYTGVPQGPLATLFWGGVAASLLAERESTVRDRLLRVAGRRKARQVARHLRGGSLLDLGAGEGYVAAALAGRQLRTVLMDLGAFFRTRLPGVVYDGHRIPLADNSVDTVLISLALHHAEDPDQVIAEALRVARLRLVVTESVYVWEWERRALGVVDRWANRTRGMTRESPEGSALGFRTVPEWTAALERHGDRVLRSKRLNVIGHRHHLFVVEPSPRRPDAAAEV